MFSQIRLGTSWEPTIPTQYIRLQQPAPSPPLPLTAPVAEMGNQQRTPSGAGTAPGVVVRNTSYAEADFGMYRALPGIIIRDLYNSNAATPPPRLSVRMTVLKPTSDRMHRCACVCHTM